MQNKKGFTLAELLIVVVIIAVLVAIAIPIFTGQLERSRKAVDLANMRSAKAAASAEYLTGGGGTAEIYYYDVASGTVISGLENARTHFTEGYGKSHSAFSEATDGGTGTPKVGDARGVVCVTIDAEGNISAAWELIGKTTVTGSNVNSYVTTDEDGNPILKFADGTLSYVSISGGSILADVTNKEEIKSIIFGGANMQDELEDNQYGDASKGLVLFDKTSGTNYLSGYSNLEYIDFTGVSVGTLSFDSVASSLKKVTLSSQDIRYNLPSGNWYYINDSGTKVYLSTLKNADGSNNAGNRIETNTHQELKGQTIYKE